jgi:hypothetical protein
MLRYQPPRYLVLLVVVGSLVACGGPAKPTEVSDISVRPSSIPVRGRAILSIDVRGSNLQFDWQATRGTIKNAATPAAEYTAPDLPGVDMVTVTVSGSGGQVVRSIEIPIVDRAVAVIPPTTPPSSPTYAPLPMLRPTSLPSAAGPFNINLREGDQVAQTETFMGQYPPNFSGALWVFIVPPGGLLYPQSPNACNGEGILRIGEWWEIRVGFGGPDNAGIPFTIVLAEADARGNQSIVDTLQQWCNANNWPGLTELPAGVVQHGDSVNVTRTAGRWGPAPPIPDAQLPGQVTITKPVQGAQVPQVFNLEGTYSGLSDAIWVLVYAPNGRWYPQSVNACAGVHTPAANGTWQVVAGFGGAGNVGEQFDIAVVLANPTANAVLDQKQREWCAAGDFKGLLTIELPPGLSEKHRVRVIRQ